MSNKLLKPLKITSEKILKFFRKQIKNMKFTSKMMKKLTTESEVKLPQ